MRTAHFAVVALSVLLASCSETHPTKSEPRQSGTVAATSPADSHAEHGTVGHVEHGSDHLSATRTNHDGHGQGHDDSQAPAQHGHASPVSDARGGAGHGSREHGPKAGHNKHTAHQIAQTSPGHGDHNPGHNQSSGHASQKKGRGETEHARHDAPVEQTDDLKDADASTIFSRRILPILKSENPSSCSQCHFAGVELRDFILEDQAKTFASLKAAGLINVAKPDDSKLLRFIGRRPEESNSLLDKVREQELIAFRSWIRAAVREPELLKATSDMEVGTTLPPEIIRHARSDRVLSSFVDNIWSEIGRCVNCHSPERNRNKIGRDGMTREDVDAISWIVPRDPEGTLRKLVESGNIDTDAPEDSQVLTKPTGLVKHGGGPKFFTGSPTYRNFLSFLKDFAAIENGRYKTTKDLPAAPEELLLLSEQQLRLTEIPAAFAGMALQVDIFRQDPATGKVSTDRWATGFSRVNGERNVWQNPILVAAPPDSSRAREFRQRKLLPAGKYVANIYVDRNRRTEQNPSYQLGQPEFVSQVEITGEWKPGYQPPKIIRFPRSRD